MALLFEKYGSKKEVDCLLQICSIGSDHFLIPVEGIFLIALQASGAVVFPVDIDKSVTLLHLPGSCADQVEGPPHGIESLSINRIAHTLMPKQNS